MPSSTIAARSIVLAALGLTASGAAFAQIPPAANVSAFNPYTGGGWASAAGQPRANTATTPAASVPNAAPVVAGGTVAVGAFNPWRTQPQGPSAISPYRTYVDNEPGANLPAPPPGPIRSRLLAVPERGDGPSTRPRSIVVNSSALDSTPRTRIVTVATRPSSASAPAPATVVAAVAPPVSTRPPGPVVSAPVVAAPIAAAPPPVAPAVVAAPPAASPAPRPAAVAAVTPPPPEAAPAPSSPGATSVTFAGQSAELTEAARAALDSLAQRINSRNTRQIELRAYAGGSGPDSRKVSLARALAVRSYLIDRGVKSRIDVGAFLAESAGGANERVDVLAPNT